MRVERSKRLYAIVYRAFHAVLLFCICVMGFGNQLGIRDMTVRDVFLAAMLLLALLGISYYQMRGKIICGILAVMLFLVIPILAGAEHAGEFWVNYGNWLVGGNNWESAWHDGYELVQCCVITLGCYLLQALGERLPWIKDASAVMLLVNLIACMCLKKNVDHTAVSFTLWYIILCFVETTQRFWKKEKGDNHREYVLRILPFCAVYLLLMCCMPAPEKPYDWQFVKDAYHSIYKQINIWIQEIGRNGQEDFGAAFKGFSEDGRLMSSLVGDDKHLLTVQGSAGLRTNVYLVGKVYDTFDGTQWTQTVTEDSRERMLDTLETLYAVKRYDGDIMENYVFSTGLSVQYQYFNTGYVFAPLKMQRLDGCEYQNSGANLVFGEQKGYGTEYKLVYYQLNVDHPQFYQMAETQLPEDAALWEKVVRDYAPRGSEEVTLEELVQYRSNEIANYHRQVVLSEEITDYLATITEKQETDIQKLQAIEKALSGLAYSENPGKLPETIASEGDFLDYFLLESQQGYCSYFATAFVLLARAEGIPARYVEGFCIPMNASKNMVVTSSMAHAWPEVYLEGIGWIPFEPTPGYAELRYTPWALKTKNNSVNSWETDLEEEEDELAGTEAEEAHLEEVQLAEREESRFWRFFLVIGVIIVVGCGLILLLDRILFNRRYRRMTPEERFEVEVRRNLWLLSRLGFTRRDEETIAELQQRVIDGLSSTGQQNTIQLHALTYYEEYRYGSCRITEDILQLVKVERKDLLMWIKQKQKWYYYVILIRLSIAKVDK